MIKSPKQWILIFVFGGVVGMNNLFGQNPFPMNGRWEVIPQKSVEIPLYRTLTVELKLARDEAFICEKWGTSRSFSDTLYLKLGGKVNKVPITNRVWPTNVFMGVSREVGATRKIIAHWLDKNQLELRVEEPVLVSQGKRIVPSTQRFSYVPNQDLLFYVIKRNTLGQSDSLFYLLKREGTRHAYFMRLKDDWRIEGELPTQAFLISLQGIANGTGPNLYFIYPDSWDFNYTRSVFDFYKNEKYFTFKEIKTPQAALERFKSSVKGYVVWDKRVRTSLIVAFTIAGLEQAVVVSEDLIPMVENAGLNMVADLRGQFTGMSDAEIYHWAYERYWPRCSKEFIIWMGGEGGPIMKPGVADWGIYKKAFFNDLSSKPSDKEEYELARKLLSEMKPMSMVMGWHSYKKDKERDHVTLVSGYGHRVEGLHTLPNLSFSSQVPSSPGFQYRNRHNIEEGKTYLPEKKVYIACVQTDGLGLGAWVKPGRGEIPYAWEVIMNYSWLAPAMMEFFYSTATPNDYFIGALSGPGYIYPKAVPINKLPPLLKEARRLMGLLDLQVFEIMDYSEGATVEGNTELTRSVVDAYYRYMPNAIGFINGYAPAFTFTCRNGKPLVSYDYYLSPTRTEEQAVADLHELAALNPKRPYFLLMHVREYSDVKRVKSILDKLGPEFEVVPLDLFLKMAGTQPTYKERFLEKK